MDSILFIIIQQTTGVIPKVFIPPYNAWNEDLIDKLIDEGFTHMTSMEELDGGIHNYDNPDLWRFPIGASTSELGPEDQFIGVSHLQTFNDIMTQRTLR